MAEPVDLRAVFDLEPADALQYFRSKGYAISLNWTDVWQQGHARAFTVAKIARYDLLQDIRRSLDEALARGETFESWQSKIIPTLRAKGWWEMADPATTGTIEPVNVTPRRLKVIYDTNLRTARAAGQWKRIQEAAAARPYLRYSAILDRRTRPQHRAWHNTVLRVDDPWWRTHFPPNGWFCRCNVQQLSERDLARYGYSVSPTAPAGGERTYISKTGFRAKVPEGIDPGFGHNPGMEFWRALTATPGAPGATPIIRTATTVLPALPAPRSLPADMLLADDVTEAEAIDALLAEFGATAGQSVTYTDAISEPLLISKAFFERDDGSSKLASSMRKQALRVVAEALKQPDEIWWSWELVRTDFNDPTKVEYRLRRRYLARFQIDGKTAQLVVVMDIGSRDWKGVTAFRAGNSSYLERQRYGTLAYQRQ